MARPLVSVVIATFNSGSYLGQAVESVLGQTQGDLELLVVDDGSTDKTRELIGRVTDTRLRYLCQENAGQTLAKNLGISAARGEFIAFCDGDDYWYPNKLELQLPLFDRARKIGVVYSAAEIVDDRGQPLGRSLSSMWRGDLSQQLFLENFVPFGTAVVRRECIERLGAFDTALTMGIDWELWLRISTSYLFEYYPGVTYAYRIWSGQMSKNWRGRYSSAFTIMEKFMRDNPGKISPRLKRRAFANTFANRARARLAQGRAQAVLDGARAVALNPFESYSWKTLARVALKPQAGSALPVRAKGLYRRAQNMARPLVFRLTAHAPRVFMYHRFSRQPQTRACGIDGFRRQMLLLRESCRIVTLGDLFTPGPPCTDPRPDAVVTVDDGYADFYDLAFPLLQELRIKATVFVTTGFISKRLWLWPDRIRAVLEAVPGGTYHLPATWNHAQIAWSNAAERERIWHFLADRLVRESTAFRDDAIADLASSLAIPLHEIDMGRFAAMNWQMLREIAAAGFEIGDHTSAHGCIVTMSESQLRTDLLASRAEIERHTATRVSSFAYPNGTANDYNSGLIERIKKLGYRQAVLSVPGPATPKRRFEIGRFSGECSLEQFTRLLQGYGSLRQTLFSSGFGANRT